MNAEQLTKALHYAQFLRDDLSKLYATTTPGCEEIVIERLLEDARRLAASLDRIATAKGAM